MGGGQGPGIAHLSKALCVVPWVGGIHTAPLTHCLYPQRRGWAETGKWERFVACPWLPFFQSTQQTNAPVGCT